MHARKSHRFAPSVVRRARWLGSLLALLTPLALGCSDSSPPAGEGGTGGGSNSNTGGGGSAGGVAPSEFAVVPKSTKKICQLTGDYDLQAEAEGGGYFTTPVQEGETTRYKTSNETFTKYRLAGTDLGSSFEHDGKLWLLFGDTFATETIPEDPKDSVCDSGPGNTCAADATAFTTDDDPTDCLDLTFLSKSATDDEPVFLPPSFDDGNLAVQQEGLSYDSAMYVWYFQGTGGEAKQSQSYLAKSTDDGQSFEVLYPISVDHFPWLNVQLVEDAEIPGLEDAGAIDWVVIAGVGPRYREADMYLALTPAATLDGEVVDEERVPPPMFYFTGLDDDGLPQWSDSESDAEAIIDTDNPLVTGNNSLGITDADADPTGCIGEFSMHYSPTAEVWIVMYNCANWSIEMHTADHPWGPWSEAERVFDPVTDGGYCDFLHLPQDWEDALELSCNHNVTVDQRTSPGSPYGPYVLERYTSGDRDAVTLYFTMSMWHPYNVLLMSTELQRK